MRARPTTGAVFLLNLLSLMVLASWSHLTATAEEKNEPVQKGEKVRISGGPGKTSVPRSDAVDGLPDSGLFNFLKRPNSGGGDFEVPISRPSNNRGNIRLLQELQDKKDNWIYVNPQTMSVDAPNKERTPEEMFNLQDELGGNSRKSSKTLEKFWTEQDRKPAAKPATFSFSTVPENRDEKLFGVSSVTDPRSQGDRAAPVNWNTLFGQKDKPDSASANSRELFGTPLIPNDNVPSALSSPSPSLPEFSSKNKPAGDEFSRLFKNVSPKSLASSPNDPINSAADSSEQDINPVVGRRLNDAANGIRSLNSLTLPPGNNLSLASFTPGSLGELNAKLAEQANQRPAFAPQPEAKAVKARPAVLELPKRNF